jgi:competence protein ComEC
MRFWNQYPFFRLILPFAAGILVAIHFPKPAVIEAWHLLAGLGLLFAVALFANIRATYTLRWLPGVFIYLFALLAGYALTVSQTEIYNPQHFGNYLGGEQALVVKVSEPPAERARSVRVFGKVQYVLDSAKSERTTGKVLLYLENDSAALNLRYGDVIIAQARVTETEPPGNPHQFNYKKYLANSGIYHQAYLRSSAWFRIDSNHVNPLFNLSYLARERMMQLLEKRGLTGDEFAVVSAILLGFDDRMEPELRNLCAGAGALHVLCVSGLHVGIIFLIVSFLLKGLEKTKQERIIKFVLLLLSIWAYAFITGLAPSVMRAGVMFSLFSWRELAKEKSNSYNVVAASAFILLAIDPYLFTKIGFQLSYSAVLAIIALNDPIYKLIAFKNKVADYVWKLVVVSIAAQIGTFPLAIYYFNQFPLYFLLSNIIVIPLVWLIVYTGIATLVFSVFWSLLSAVVAKLLYFQVFLLNYSVELVNKLPHAKIEGLILLFPQVIALYLLIFLIVRFFIKKEGKYAVVALSLALLLSGSFVFQRSQALQQKKLVIYKVNGHSAMDFTFGNQLIAFADSSLLKDSRTLAFNVESNRVYSGVVKETHFSFQSDLPELFKNENLPLKYFSPDLLLAGNTRVALVGKNFPLYNPDEPLKTNLVILCQNTTIPIGQMVKMFDFDQLVFDSSNDPRKIREWKKYCDEHQISYYDVREKGALVREL